MLSICDADAEFNKIGHAIVSFAHQVLVGMQKTRSWSIIYELILDSLKVHQPEFYR